MLNKVEKQMNKEKYIRSSGSANQRMTMKYKADSGSSNDCQIEGWGKDCSF